MFSDHFRNLVYSMYSRFLKATTSFYFPLNRLGTTSTYVDHYAVLGVKPEATSKVNAEKVLVYFIYRKSRLPTTVCQSSIILTQIETIKKTL